LLIHHIRFELAFSGLKFDQSIFFNNNLMKFLVKIVALAIFSFSFQVSKATVRIVNNNVNSPAQYTNLQTAIDASAVGDTVYIQGSQSNYGSITINRRMVLIGAGYNTNMVSNIGSVNLDTNLTAIPAQPISGVRIVGCNIGGLSFTSGANGLVHNVILERNLIGSINIGGNGWIIRNNTINSGTIYLNNFSNYVISNNVFAPGRINGGSSSAGIIVANNIFLNDLSGNSLNQVSNATVINNIFWYPSSTTFNNVLGCVFNNNLVYGSSTITLPFTGNTGSNNLNSTNPFFINVPVTTTATSVPNYNFLFTAGSQAINAGTDGTNLGVTGGVYQMTTFNGLAPIPLVTEFNINNPIVYPNQQLNVNFKAKKIN